VLFLWMCASAIVNIVIVGVGVGVVVILVGTGVGKSVSEFFITTISWIRVWFW